MSEQTCWRSECRRGCYYPDMCSERPPPAYPPRAERRAESEGDRMTLRRDIESAINRNSAENGSDTPDYILARFIEASLAAFDMAVRDRDEWHMAEIQDLVRADVEQTADQPRVKVACINWSYPDAPHALIYLLRQGEAVAEEFVDTWDDAMALVPRYARATERTEP